MNEFSRFYVDLFRYIWEDIKDFFVNGLWNDIIKKFFDNLQSYWDLLMRESVGFSIISWVLVLITFILNLSLIVFLAVRFYIWLRRFAAFRAVEIEKNDLIDEIAMLNDKVVDLVDEKNQILAMKVSQLGINARTGQSADQIITGGIGGAGTRLVPGGLTPVGAAVGASGNVDGRIGGGMVAGGPTTLSGEDINIKNTGDEDSKKNSRFVKLIQVDNQYAGKDTHIYMEEEDYVTLEELVERFVNFACSRMKLYYSKKMVSLFFAGLASSKVMILEGISGTGKTSLPYAMSKFFDTNAAIISVQPSWRDRAEIIGYLNEFTKRFNETEFLKALYEAIYRKDVAFIVLDEMNLARIEYYFAEFLSIMEMPDPSEWKIDLVPDSRNSDPIKVINGKITVPNNVWFVGTANKDDSTYTITDKVYDRAIALEFEGKGEPFEAPETNPIHISSSYLQELFDEAFYKYPVSEELLAKFAILDKYVATTFKIGFGNRIMTQVHKFIPVYVSCGGTEEDGLDYIFANKVLRKFESLNLAFLQAELKDLIMQIQKIFGKNAFEESIKYIHNMQKLI